MRAVIIGQNVNKEKDGHWQPRPKRVVNIGTKKTKDWQQRLWQRHLKVMAKRHDEWATQLLRQLVDKQFEVALAPQKPKAMWDPYLISTDSVPT